MSAGTIKCGFKLPPKEERPRYETKVPPKIPRASEIILSKPKFVTKPKRQTAEVTAKKTSQQQEAYVLSIPRQAGKLSSKRKANEAKSQMTSPKDVKQPPDLVVKRKTIADFFNRQSVEDNSPLEEEVASKASNISSRCNGAEFCDEIWTCKPLAAMQDYCKEVQQKLDAGELFLNGNPWLLRPCAEQVARAKHTKQKELGRDGLDSATALHCALRPSLFVWDPKKLGQNIEILCPECGRPGRKSEWNPPRILHGISDTYLYMTRTYTCNECDCSKGQAQGRKRTKFSADAPSVRSSLPSDISAMYTFFDTGRTLCEITLIDLIRSMATKTSWSAVAESLNEGKATTWIRSVTLPYQRICTELSLKPLQNWPASLPTAYLLSDKWVRNVYVKDAEQRNLEMMRELQATVGHDVLMVDWTKDAAKRSSAIWLFNIMDCARQILGFRLTSTCKPYEVRDLLTDLATRGTNPKVVYVDDECCGGWRDEVKKVWPEAHVRLDPMHALRRLTQTTSSTRHPWHDEFCIQLSNSFYEWDQEALQRLRAARVRDGLVPDMTRADLLKYVPRKIAHEAAIVRAVENTLNFFSSRNHAAHGHLLTKATLESWQALKQHIVKGCLCDPPNVSLYHPSDRQIVLGGESFPTLQSRRGSSALEGFHLHQKQWLGALAQHSTEAGTLLLNEGAVRWNRKRRRKEMSSTSSLMFAGGLLQEAGLTA